MTMQSNTTEKNKKLTKVLLGLGVFVGSALLIWVQTSLFENAGKVKVNQYTTHINEIISVKHDIGLVKLDLYKSIEILKGIDLRNTETLPSNYIPSNIIYAQYFQLMSDNILLLGNTAEYIEKEIKRMDYFAELNGELSTKINKDVQQVVESITEARAIKDQLNQYLTELDKFISIDKLLADPAKDSQSINIDGSETLSSSGTFNIRLQVLEPPSFDHAYTNANSLAEEVINLLGSYSSAVEQYNKKANFQQNIKNVILIILGLLIAFLTFATLLNDIKPSATAARNENNSGGETTATQTTTSNTVNTTDQQQVAYTPPLTAPIRPQVTQSIHIESD